MLSPVEEIKARIDIAELVQSYVKLQKAGAYFKANCPFHGERTPSFFVTPSRQIWHCFGCGLGGDIFKFVMQIEGMDFPEALKLLAQRAGVALTREDPALRSERNRLYDICEHAAKIFEKTLARIPAVQSYLTGRMVSEKTVREFRIGYAPEAWDFLLKNLGRAGFSSPDIEKAGLVIRASDGSGRHYDRFRSRIMFPITDTNGRVIGFGGRIFTPPEQGVKSSFAKTAADAAKYINTPQTPIYDKSRALYGFDKAKQEIRIQNSAVIVEGYMDCVMSHQAGVKNTVAVSGTALTPQQLTMLKRLCDTVICSFDTDSAGESATKRSVALAAQFEFDRLVIRIPSGKDPADTVAEHPEAWQQAVQSAKPVVEFYFEKMLREHDPATATGKKAISAVLLPIIADINNEVEKAHWVSELSRRLGVAENTIAKELDRKKYRSDAGHQFVASADAAPEQKRRSRREMLEERYLSLLSALSAEERLREKENQDMVFTAPQRRDIFDVLTVAGTESDERIELLRFRSEVMIEQSAASAAAEFLLCKTELRKAVLKDRLEQLTQDIRRNEQSGDRAGVTSLLRDFRTISETLKSLSA